MENHEKELGEVEDVVYLNLKATMVARYGGQDSLLMLWGYRNGAASFLCLLWSEP